MALSHNFELRSRFPQGHETTAFDYAHESLPAKLQENDRAKRRLALLILRHIERGEHDPERLATSAVLDFFR